MKLGDLNLPHFIIFFQIKSYTYKSCHAYDLASETGSLCIVYEFLFHFYCTCTKTNTWNMV